VIEQIRFEVQESSQVAEARRGAANLAQRFGFDESAVGRIMLAVTEAATNLTKHARQGELLVRPIEDRGRLGIEVLALDRGPGIADVALCLRDGYSTAGSPGTGLGALSRVPDEFDLHTMLGKGTVVRVVVWATMQRITTSPAMTIGVVCQPKPGEEVCGDDWAAELQSGRAVLGVADGLGHGPDARKAARATTTVLHANPGRNPGAIVEGMHAAARATRGSAVGVCEVDLTQSVCRFAGVGNIACTVVGETSSRQLVSHNGIVGHSMRAVQEFSVPWPQTGLVVMHSDGVSTQWDLAAYPGLRTRHPALIAAVLYRDFSRHRDDATVLVAKQSPGGSA
jgi:anti-sigma regulatory factor (Ser/Thr protein kinase)